MYKELDTVFDFQDYCEEDYTRTGEGARNLLVLIAEKDFGADERTTLANMMKAIQYDLQRDVTCMVLQDNRTSTLSWSEEYKDLIVFGIQPSKIGLDIDFNKYEILHFEKARVLICDSMKEIIRLPTHKKTLWIKLQEMFLK